jgi:hypothetical protein
MKYIFVMLNFALFSCGTETNKTPEEPTKQEEQTVLETSHFEVNSSLVRELFVFEDHDQSKYPLSK